MHFRLGNKKGKDIAIMQQVNKVIETLSSVSFFTCICILVSVKVKRNEKDFILI